MDSDRYHEIFPNTCIVGQFAKAGEAKRSLGLFEVVGHRGRYRAAGVGGGITGEPADILIVDDPIKDFAEAMSDTIRDTVYNWLTSTALTRLQEGGGVIIMATRWHMDDSIGRLLERQPNRWKLINFRAIAEADEPPYRLAGEPLSAERYSLQSLMDIRDGGAMSSYQWAALFQQRPSPVGGGIFKRDDWQWYQQPPDTFDQILQSWDCAFKDSSDYVCGGVIGVKGPHKYVLDVINQRLTFQGTKNAIKTMSGKWPDAWQKLIEDKANGTAVINDLRDEVPGLIAVEPEGGKIARAHAISGEVEAHNVFLPDPTVLDAPWVHDFVEQFAGFPTAAHDDQVDMLTQALAYIRKHSWGLFAWLKEQAESMNAELNGTGASPSDVLADAQKYESGFAISRNPNLPSCRPPAPKHKIEHCPQCGATLAIYAERRICNPCGWSNKE
jgi:predicted phage terminase large subunit-like protein